MSKAVLISIRPEWCESCAMYSERNGTCRNAGLQITRPPQSWRYVEEKIWSN